MATLPTRVLSSFQANIPVTSLNDLDGEFNQLVGAAGIFNGGTTGVKLLIKASDAADPPVEIDQTGAGPLAEWKQNGSLKASINNAGDVVANGITGAAGVYTFGSIPVGPASNPTTDNQLARKAYIDGKKVSFAVSFSIPDPSTATLNQNDFGSMLVPAGGQYTITKCKVFFVTGSHTAGGSLTFGVSRQGVGNIATLTLDNTNNAANAVYTDDIGDLNVSENEILTPFISARSGTITERNVSIVVEGFRLVF